MMQADAFLLLADQLPEGMLLVLADGKVLAVNRVAARQLGHAASQLVGCNLAQLTGLAAEKLRETLIHCARSRRPIRLALHSSQADSAIKIPACEGFLVTPAKSGQLAQIVIRLLADSRQTNTFLALNQQIDKQRRILRRLEQSQERLRLSEENLSITLSSIGDAVIVTDKEGLLTLLNPVAEQLTGWSNEEASGLPIKTVFPIIDASTRKSIENPIEKVLTTGETVYLSNHTTLISKNGTEYQIADSAAPIRERDGSEILGMVLVFNDVSEQYRLREENIRSKQKLQTSEKLYRNLIETTSAVAWEFDLVTQRCTYMGPGILALTGYPAEQWVDLDSWVNRIHPDDRTDTVNYGQLETAKGLDHTLEYRAITAAGRCIWIRDEVSVISHEGKAVLTRGYFFDITEHKQTEEALRRAQKMEAVGQLTGGIAHDFNNILGIILGNLELLQRQGIADKKVQKRLDNIKYSSERAAALTRRLLAFSRSEAASIKTADINDVIGNMESLIARSLTPQIEVKYCLEENLRKADIDCGDFEDALLNLVLNARDAMAGNGKLSIETFNSTLDEAYCLLNPGVVAGQYIQLAVSDNGSGIPAEQQANIFEPFYTTKEQGKGTGLGLSMVFGFVVRSLGHIMVYSEPDVGSTFRLYLPLSQNEGRRTETASVNNTYLRGGKESILIVDDEPALLALAEELLAGLGYNVITASDGKQALQQLEKGLPIDLLFSDVVMPGGINGYELAEQAVVKYPALKVLLTSGYTEMAVAHNGQARFEANVLAKPYAQVVLTQRIRQCLDEDEDEG